MTALAITRAAAFGLARAALSGSAMAQDLAMGALAQCWKATVRINTKMETGSLNPTLTGDQIQSLNKAIAARDSENYGACVEALKNIPGWDK
jgi:hypothetical protein